jgi:heme/copper-type cytochrome/quinol oxidase subunit 2
LGFVRESQNVLLSQRGGHASSVLSDLATSLLMILAVVWVLQVVAFMIAVLLYRRASPARDGTEQDESGTLRNAA